MNKTLEAIGQAIFKHWFVDFEFPNEEGKPYKSSGGEMVYNEELGKEIPKGWKVGKIGENLKTILGGTPDTTNKLYWENGTIPWINSGAINEFPIVNPSRYITEEGLKNSATKLIPKKTVVLPFVISLDKEIKISITGINTCGNQSVLGIIENEKIPSEFIYYWIEYMKEDIYCWATGGAQQHINKNVVERTNILIPNDFILKKYKQIMVPIFNKIIINSHYSCVLTAIRDFLLPKLMFGKIRVPVEVVNN
jgi:type I restriction enzyme S subunit